MTTRPIPLALCGDSLTAGYAGASPAQYMLDYFNGLEPGLVTIENMAVSGTSASQFIDGHAPQTPYYKWIRSTTAKIVVIRYGGIEALFDPSNNLMAGFRENIDMLIDLAIERQKHVVLVGKINIPVSEQANEKFQCAYNRTQTILEHIMIQRKGTTELLNMISLDHIPAGVMLDPIHPAKAYQDQHTQAICDGLMGLFGH